MMEAFIAEFGLKILGVLIAFFGVLGYGIHQKGKGKAEVSSKLKDDLIESMIDAGKNDEGVDNASETELDDIGAQWMRDNENQ